MLQTTTRPIYRIEDAKFSDIVALASAQPSLRDLSIDQVRRICHRLCLRTVWDDDHQAFLDRADVLAIAEWVDTLYSKE